MIRSNAHSFDSKRDLVLERIVDVPREQVWLAWTRPEHLKQWFTPAPWRTIECEIDLRPGGVFRTVTRSPEGQDFPSTCSYLEVIENEKLVWTDGLMPGFRPSNRLSSWDDQLPNLTAIITLEAHEQGTKYTAVVLHKDEESRQRHENMGFHKGWNAALDQLVAVAKRMR